MQKKHLVILILLAGLLMSSVLLFADISTYASVEEVLQKPGVEFSLIVKLDTSAPISYDALKNPNYLTFSVVDSLGNKLPVVYHDVKPTDIERAEKLVLKGYVNRDDVFECSEILMKCPSKYNDDGSGGALLPNS